MRTLENGKKKEAGERGNACGNLFRESLERESNSLEEVSVILAWTKGSGSVGREAQVEISGVFVNGDVHIAEVLHIFLRERGFPSRSTRLYKDPRDFGLREPQR